MVNAFGPADNARFRGVEVIRNAPQPETATTESIYWPATTWASLNVEAMVDRTWAHGHYNFVHWIWGNREYKTTANSTGAEGGWLKSRFSGYPFPVPSVDHHGDIRSGRFLYSTMAKADGATVAHVMHSLGHSMAEILADPWVVAGGWVEADIEPASVWNADAETHFTEACGTDNAEFWGCRDKVYLPEGRIVDVPDHAGFYRGILLDAEHQDGRSGAHALSFYTHLKSLCDAAGIKLTIWPNALTNTGALYSGFTATSIPQIIEQCHDLSALFYNDGTGTSFAQRINETFVLIPPEDLGKISVTYSLGNPNGHDTTVEDARVLRVASERLGLRAIKIWRNYATPGGDADLQVNRELAALLFGDNVPRLATWGSV